MRVVKLLAILGVALCKAAAEGCGLSSYFIKHDTHDHVRNGQSQSGIVHPASKRAGGVSTTADLKSQGSSPSRIPSMILPSDRDINGCCFNHSAPSGIDIFEAESTYPQPIMARLSFSVPSYSVTFHSGNPYPGTISIACIADGCKHSPGNLSMGNFHLLYYSHRHCDKLCSHRDRLSCPLYEFTHFHDGYLINYIHRDHYKFIH
ncbi:uncharacterized protein N7473_013126 [Penicillium subrubescens]|uniref:uncharacterized protein n=1 Tax=Penicillium subrubescens TaxID=1316194 RepID=UPI002544DCA2|nr:uncharacterized protein N7473_013126 [Penicillium subrubescens]KAJ5875013.1 hypothetical protein N7473_013126 [Penicillium subrubescens]